PTRTFFRSAAAAAGVRSEAESVTMATRLICVTSWARGDSLRPLLAGDDTGRRVPATGRAVFLGEERLQAMLDGAKAGQRSERDGEQDEGRDQDPVDAPDL